MEYDLLPVHVKHDAPAVGEYDPKTKFLSTERRTTMAPELDKMTEERFIEDKKALNPAANQYDVNTKLTDRRNTAAPMLDKQTSERFGMDKDQLNAPACNQYAVDTKAVDRRTTMAP